MQPQNWIPANFKKLLFMLVISPELHPGKIRKFYGTVRKIDSNKTVNHGQL